MLTGNSSEKPSTPSNNFLRTLDEIEKSVYDAQAKKQYYSLSPRRLENIKYYIKLAAKNNNNEFIRQALGHGLYTAIEIEKRKSSRKKRCVLCESAVRKYLETIKKELEPEHFEKMMGVNEKVTLMFAIDTTGSMSGEIATAKAIAKSIVNSPRQTEVDYILSPFNDPGMCYGFLHWQNFYGKILCKALEAKNNIISQTLRSNSYLDCR